MVLALWQAHGWSCTDEDFLSLAEQSAARQNEEREQFVSDLPVALKDN